MAQRVCPWWLGYLLASPLRRLVQNPRVIVEPYVRSGMTVIEPGPGMGFFTIDLARIVGPSGKVIAIDLQRRMLRGLVRRAARAGVAGCVETRAVTPDATGMEDLIQAADFVLVFAVAHEMPDLPRFFEHAARAMKPGARLLLAEPRGHVSEAAFATTARTAEAAGLRRTGTPAIPRSHAALFERPAA